MPREVTWQDRSEYGLARGIEGLLSRLPRRWAEGVGRSLGSVAGSIVRVRRDVVEENLRRAFPDADAEWVARIAAEAYAHLGRETIATVRLSELPPEAVIRRTTSITGWGEFEEAIGQGHGAILVTGHFGNWEVAAAAVAARGVPIDAVMKRMRNPLLDAHLERARERLGIGTVDMAAAPRQVPRSLAAGRAIGMVADQDARSSGVWVPFFGRPASTHRGPALFSLRFGAPLFASSIRRLPDGNYDLLTERVQIERTGDLSADVLALTRAWTERLEAAIRRAPEQYFWFHKRWKTPPPTEPEAGLPGIT